MKPIKFHPLTPANRQSSNKNKFYPLVSLLLIQDKPRASTHFLTMPAQTIKLLKVDIQSPNHLLQPKIFNSTFRPQVCQ